MPQRNRTGQAGISSMRGCAVDRCAGVGKSDLDRLGSGRGGRISRLGMGIYSGIGRMVDEMSLGRSLRNDIEDLKSELVYIKKHLSEIEGE